MNPRDDAPAPPPEPRYRLEVASADDTLLVQVHGAFDAQAVRIAYWCEIVALAKARGHRKLLVTDRKKSAPATPEELAEMARIFAPEAPHFDRIAVVEITPAFVPALEHGEISARSVGINLRVFADREAARRWLHYAPAEDG